MKKIPDGQPIRIAFLGCGFAAKIHSKTLSKIPGVERFYASRNGEKAAAFNKKHNGHGHFDSYGAAIASPNIDAVLVLTPPSSHKELALAAVRAGKHVIVEKPPFLRASDFDKVAAEAAKTGVQTMVAENYFYKPSLARLRETLASGVIGDPKFIYLNATKSQKTQNWRDDPALAGGGALFEGGIHWINFLSNLGYVINKVSGHRPAGQGGLDRSSQAVFEFKNGPVATLLYSWETGALLNGLRISRIYGTEGSITFETNGIFIFVRGKKWRFILPGLADIAGYRAMFQDFTTALREGRPPEFNWQLARRDLEILNKLGGI